MKRNVILVIVVRNLSGCGCWREIAELVINDGYSDVDYRTMISCYFIDKHKRVCHKITIDTVLVESAKMILKTETRVLI